MSYKKRLDYLKLHLPKRGQNRGDLISASKYLVELLTWIEIFFFEAEGGFTSHIESIISSNIVVCH